jgi:hypothetical protein
LSVASGQKLLFVSYGLVTQAAGSVLLGILSYLAYYVLFNRGMFAEARSILRR